MPATALQQSVRASGSSGDLIYAIGDGGNAYIYTYPAGSLVTGIALELTINICSDQHGNVYITDTGGGSNGAIREYAHGETNPTQILAFNGFPNSCSVDATTGDLAVTNGSSSGSGGIAIYQNAQGSPTYLAATNLTNYKSCTYDNRGNLFVDGDGSSGELLDVLAKGSTNFTAISLNKAPGGAFGRLQWIGSYLAISVDPGHKIYHVTVSGSSGSINGTTRASKLQNWWVQGNTLLSPYGNRSTKIAFWNYPKGGKPDRAVKAHVSLAALTVSVGSSQ